MIRAALLGAIIVIMASHGSVRAQALLSTAGLVEDCRHRWPDPEYFYCTGYLSGVLQILHAGMVVRRSATGAAVAVQSEGAPDALCIVSRLKPEVLAKSFVEFVDRHPDKLGEAANGAAADALIALDEAPPATPLASDARTACQRKPVSARER